MSTRHEASQPNPTDSVDQIRWDQSHALSICMLTYELPASMDEAAVSGQANNPFYLVRGLQAAGHGIVVASVPSLTRAVSSTRLRAGSDPPTYDVPDGRSRALPRYALRIRNVTRFLRVIQGGPFDVIHAQHPALGAAALIARRTSRRHRGTPVVTTGHGTSLPEADADGFVSLRQSLRVANQRLLLPIDSAALKGSDAVISVSEFQRRELAQIYRVPASRISVIYNGVDRSRYRPDVAPSTNRVRAPYKSCRPLILFVGRLAPKKGLQYLIRAFPQIRDSLPDAHCLVIGGTPAYDTYGATLKRLAHEVGVADCFTWVGEGVAEADLPAVYTSADICVFPSENYESLPTVIFEAMACGVPVVTTNRWGSPEALGADHPGLVPEGDPDAIARAIGMILGDESLRETVIQRQLKSIERFDLNRTVGEHERLYFAVARPDLPRS